MYLVLSITGKPVSRHRTIEAAARKIVQARAQDRWSLAAEGARGPLMLEKDEQQLANEIMRAAKWRAT